MVVLHIPFGHQTHGWPWNLGRESTADKHASLLRFGRNGQACPKIVLGLQAPSLTEKKESFRAILGQLENVVKNIYPEGGTFAGMLGHMPFLLKDN